MKRKDQDRLIRETLGLPPKQWWLLRLWWKLLEGGKS
jgi:hypothetical protein